MPNKRDRLNRLIDTFFACVDIDKFYLQNQKEKLADWLRENGVIVPPCKVGDRIYSIFTSNGKTLKNCIETHGDKITQIKINRGGYHFKCWWGYFHMTDIGKTVFLTKESAERALKEGADNG